MVWFTYKNNEEHELKQKSSKQIERMLAFLLSLQ